MQPRDRVKLGDLAEGDRFYFLSDAKRTVWARGEVDPRQVKQWRHAGHLMVADIKVINDAGGFRWCQSRTTVVFLRHADQGNRAVAG